MTDYPKHNHFTHDIKSIGKCHSCDLMRVMMQQSTIDAHRMMIRQMSEMLRHEHEYMVGAPLPHKRPCTTCERLEQYEQIIASW